MNSHPQPATVKPLAIIIPAYKTRFLRAALESVAAQTDHNFQLYVFDDGSPEPVGKIIREPGGRLPVKFHRFSENLGRVSLVRHLERCIRLTSEPWVWIFADDDVMEAGCVADFYAELDRTQSAHDLYRFNTVWVDGAGGQIAESPRHPPVESGTDFLLARLTGKRKVTLQEIIFSRRAWESAGGLPDFPLGWHADEAFTASLGMRQPLRTIAGARIYWRFSNLNITSTATFAVINLKVMASTQFFRWVVKFFQAHDAARTEAAVRASEAWLMNYLRTCWEFLGWRTCVALDTLAFEAWQRPRGWGLFTGLELNLTLLAQKAGRCFRSRSSGVPERSVYKPDKVAGAVTAAGAAGQRPARPEILFITSHDPDSADYGAVVRARNIIRLLGQVGDVRVVLAGFHEPWTEHPQGTCGGFPLLRTIRFEWSEEITIADRVRQAVDPRFMNLDWLQARAEDTAWLKRTAAEHDLVWVHGLQTANRCNLWRWPQAVLDVDDIISEVHNTHREAAASLRHKAPAFLKHIQWRRREELLPERFDACCVCSEPDLEKLRHAGKTFVVPNGFNPPRADYARRPAAPVRVGFVGNFEYAPNLRGMNWFVNEVWPQILQKNPAARLRLVGAGGREQAWPAGQNIEPLGWLEEVESEMATWSLTVAPILTGGGTRVKLAEAFSRRCPAVSTSLGAYGYDVTDGQELFIADDRGQFAARCMEIMDDPVAGEKLAANAWNKFTQLWTWDAQAGRVAAVVKQVLAASQHKT
ncbi:MAG: glycosyltransferase [Verrucomicrobiae bacterium]|nr:glycosyltransferase [Verrucomicrobiae bacterium]